MDHVHVRSVLHNNERVKVVGNVGRDAVDLERFVAVFWNKNGRFVVVFWNQVEGLVQCFGRKTEGLVQCFGRKMKGLVLLSGNKTEVHCNFSKKKKKNRPVQVDCCISIIPSVTAVPRKRKIGNYGAYNVPSGRRRRSPSS